MTDTPTPEQIEAAETQLAALIEQHAPRAMELFQAELAHSTKWDDALFPLLLAARLLVAYGESQAPDPRYRAHAKKLLFVLLTKEFVATAVDDPGEVGLRCVRVPTTGDEVH